MSSTVFEGSWIIIEHNRTLPSPVWIREDKSVHKELKIETENIAFNNQFTAESEDGHTAFLILTPNFMESLITFNKKSN